MSATRHLAAMMLVMTGAGAAGAQVIFADDFNAGASPMWGNERGGWVAQGGVYFATMPSNSPTTYTLLPFVVGDCTIEVDVGLVSDGGVWLRVDNTRANGVLLVTGGNIQTGRGLYWHIVRGGGFSGILAHVTPLFNQGGNIHLRITVVGDVYSAFLNGATTPTTSITVPDFPTGKVGLYDFASPRQVFDNFVLSVPCAADFNGDGNLDPDDLSDYITCFFTVPACGGADFNGDGNVDPDDLSDYITAFFTGCA